MATSEAYQAFPYADTMDGADDCFYTNDAYPKGATGTCQMTPAERDITKRSQMGACLTVDFTALARRRSSTSTPNLSCTMSKPLSVMSPFPSSVVDDSGFLDNIATRTFISCGSTEPLASHRRSDLTPCSMSPDFPQDVTASPKPELDSELFAMPLPKLSLLSEFMECKDCDEDVKSATASSEKSCRSCERLQQEDLTGSHRTHSRYSTANSSRQKRKSLDSLSVSLESDANHFLSHAMRDRHNATVESGYESQLSLSNCDLQSSLNSSRGLFAGLGDVLSHFTPREPDRLIGRKIGAGKMDIIGQLSARNLTIPLQKIFEYLDDEDLCKFCCVSSQWDSVCRRDHGAQCRKNSFLKAKHDLAESDQKENCLPKKLRSRGLTNGKHAFAEVQFLARNRPLDESTPIAKCLPGRSTQFWEQASQLRNDESLRKCPKCSSPAKAHKVQERACCTNQSCSFDYCIKCSLAFHGAIDCVSATNANANPKRKTDKVGSKSSKKNLRRL